MQPTALGASRQYQIARQALTPDTNSKSNDGASVLDSIFLGCGAHCDAPFVSCAPNWSIRWLISGLDLYSGDDADICSETRRHVTRFLSYRWVYGPKMYRPF